MTLGSASSSRETSTCLPLLAYPRALCRINETWVELATLPLPSPSTRLSWPDKAHTSSLFSSLERFHGPTKVGLG